MDARCRSERSAIAENQRGWGSSRDSQASPQTRSCAAVEIRHLVDGLAVGVAPEEGEVLTHALLNLEYSPLVNGSSKRRILVVLEKRRIHEATEDICGAWEPRTRTPLPDGDVRGPSR